jgi:hypothetical protein
LLRIRLAGHYQNIVTRGGGDNRSVTHVLSFRGVTVLTQTGLVCEGMNLVARDGQVWGIRGGHYVGTETAEKDSQWELRYVERLQKRG